MTRFTQFLFAVSVAGAVGCSNGTTTTDTVQQDATNTSDIAVACGEAGFNLGDSSMPTCVLATSCNGQPFCPAQTVNDTTHPKFVVTEIDIQTPASLNVRGAVGPLLNTNIAQGNFFWGMAVDTTNGTMITGALDPNVTAMPGSDFLQTTFHFLSGTAPAGDAGMSTNRWDPVTATVSVMGEAFATASPEGGMYSIPIVTIPVFNPDHTTPLAELPLRNATFVNVQMNTNRNCIGLAKASFNTCVGGRWWTDDMHNSMGMPYGQIQADLTVADTQAIIVTNLGPLCDLVAGVPCATTPDMSAWHTPPDTAVNGSATPNAWHIVANFAAVSANIAP